MLEWEDSIKADIKESQNRINEFNKHLFYKITLDEWVEITEDDF